MGLYLVAIFLYFHEKHNDTKVQVLVLPAKPFNFTIKYFLERNYFVSAIEKQLGRIFFEKCSD